MNTENEALKPGECDPAFLARILIKAMNYAGSDPETALMYARKGAEAICSSIFARAIGDPGQSRLDKLIELLANKDKIPERIKIPMRVIQQYGNYGAHYQAEQRMVDRTFVDPCLSALLQVSNWFFLEYLKIPIPIALARANNDFSPEEEAPAFASSSIDDLKAIALAMGLPWPLRSYQWEGVSFLARSRAALLADEMGLGKTVQTIVAFRLLLQTLRSGRVLIVAPNSLALNWQREIEDWAPELVVRRLTGDSADRLATYGLPVKVLIATYDQIRADAVDLDEKASYDVIVLDEAQRLKNRRSMSALSCRLIRSDRTWLLTGTPLENRLEDLASLFLFLQPGLIDATMSPAQVHDRIKPFFLRRRKVEVLGEMPPIVVQDVHLELDGQQASAYLREWTNGQSQRERSPSEGSTAALLTAITRLKQLCNYDPTSGESVKIDALETILESCTETADRIIVFSQYVETLKFMATRIREIPFDFYTGEQDAGDRDLALRKFRTEPGPRVLLTSLQAGGVGLNIKEASCVVLFDRWWNPAVESQAIQRAHRFGRESTLLVFRFLVKGTIEERIAEVLRDKEVDFDRYIEKAESAATSMFTSRELRMILGLGEKN
jgi:SNF2 family DNA or RNA helicase